MYSIYTLIKNRQKLVQERDESNNKVQNYYKNKTKKNGKKILYSILYSQTRVKRRKTRVKLAF